VTPEPPATDTPITPVEPTTPIEPATPEPPVIPVVEPTKPPDETTTDKPEDEIGKGAIPFADHGTAPETEAWDAAGEMAKATDSAGWKAMCAWFDSAKPDDKGSYKLPHHLGDSGHKAVWRGVAAAMAALLGARGGVDIPEGDRKGVYSHLSKHYDQFKKNPPDFKMVEDQVLAGLSEEILALTLDREEKHTARLVKKAIDSQKDGVEKIVRILTLLDQSLSLYKQNHIEGGAV
jgi:hypothetical protein